MARKLVAPQELGTTGVQHWGGVIREEWLPELQGPEAARVYQKMRDESPVVGASFGTISALLQQATLRARPFKGSTDSDDLRVANFVDECLSDLKRGQAATIASLLSMLTHGWSVHEPTYRARLGYQRDPDLSSRFHDGLIGWGDWAPRLQRTLYRWDMKDNGSVRAMVQVAPPDYRERTLPVDRILHLVADASTASPEGRSCLRNAYDPWYAARHVQYVERIGIERDLVGVPVAELPSDIMDAEDGTPEAAIRERYHRMVTSLFRNEHEGIVWCSDRDEKGNPLYVLRLLSTGGTRQFDTTKILERLERGIAMALLADWIFLGHQAEGSFALADSRTATFAAAIGGWLKILVQGVQTQLVPRLLEVNGWRTDRCPEVYHTDIETPDLGKMGDYLSKLYAAQFPFDWQNNPTLVQHLLQIANLPTRAVDALRGEAGEAGSGDGAEPAEPDAAAGEPAGGESAEAA